MGGGDPSFDFDVVGKVQHMQAWPCPDAVVAAPVSVAPLAAHASQASLADGCEGAAVRTADATLATSAEASYEDAAAVMVAGRDYLEVDRYSWHDRSAAASVYVDLPGLAESPDSDLAVSVDAWVVSLTAVARGLIYRLAVGPLFGAISEACLVRKPGKSQVALRLVKQHAGPWASLCSLDVGGGDEPEGSGADGPEAQGGDLGGGVSDAPDGAGVPRHAALDGSVAEGAGPLLSASSVRELQAQAQQGAVDTTSGAELVPLVPLAPVVSGILVG